jgi:hypothetical protein
MAPQTATVESGPAKGGSSLSGGFWKLPESSLGWWAVGLTVLIFPVAWVLMTHTIPLEILDTWVSPAILVALIDAAAVVGVLAVWRRRERSILAVVALVFSGPLAVFATIMMVLEVLFPH